MVHFQHLAQQRWERWFPPMCQVQTFQHHCLFASVSSLSISHIWKPGRLINCLFLPCPSFPVSFITRTLLFHKNKTAGWRKEMISSGWRREKIELSSQILWIKHAIHKKQLPSHRLSLLFLCPALAASPRDRAAQGGDKEGHNQELHLAYMSDLSLSCHPFFIILEGTFLPRDLEGCSGYYNFKT